MNATNAEIKTPQRAMIATVMVGLIFVHADIAVKYSAISRPALHCSTLSALPLIEEEAACAAYIMTVSAARVERGANTV